MGSRLQKLLKLLESEDQLIAAGCTKWLVGCTSWLAALLLWPAVATWSYPALPA